MATYYVDPGNTNVTAWQANHVYSEGDYVCPTDLTTADAKSVYECTTGGTSHASTEPTWDETAGNTTSDGTVTWTARAPDSWDEALLSLQPAADLATAGDTVYCQGTQALSAAIDFDTNSGTYDGGYIRFIGVKDGTTNAPPQATDYATSADRALDADAGYFILNGQDNAINGIYANAVHFIWFENIKIHSCNGAAGISTAYVASNYWVLQNVWLHDNNGHGFSGGVGYFADQTFIGCKFTNNRGSGVCTPVRLQATCCTFANNGGDGAFLGNTNNICCFTNCIFHNNAGRGIYAYRTNFCINCIFDGNGGHGIEWVSPWSPMFVGCRFTNNNQASKEGIYVNNSSSRVGLFCCYFGNNTTDVTAGRYDIIPINGATDHVILGGSDTNHGYTDQTADDFNLRSDASIRAQAIELD